MNGTEECVVKDQVKLVRGRVLEKILQLKLGSRVGLQFTRLFQTQLANVKSNGDFITRQ